MHDIFGNIARFIDGTVIRIHLYIYIYIYVFFHIEAVQDNLFFLSRAHGWYSDHCTWTTYTVSSETQAVKV